MKKVKLDKEEKNFEKILDNYKICKPIRGQKGVLQLCILEEEDVNEEMVNPKSEIE